MRTTLDIPDLLFRELKAQAALRGMKMKDLLTELVERGLRGSIPATSRQRSPLPITRRTTGQSIPARSNAELQQLLDDEDAQHHAQPDPNITHSTNH